jgi:cold-inducible RNA-binding protein
MGRRLFVGNLSYETTELELRDLFGQIGTVAEAIEQFNGREFGGRAIAVNEAQERSGGGGGRGGGGGGRGRY